MLRSHIIMANSNLYHFLKGNRTPSNNFSNEAKFRMTGSLTYNFFI